MHRSGPFSRFNALMGAILMAGVGTPTAHSLAATYVSRGHGKGKLGRVYRRGTDWSHASGQREALRRYRRAQGGPGLRLIGGTWVART